MTIEIVGHSVPPPQVQTGNGRFNAFGTCGACWMPIGVTINLREAPQLGRGTLAELIDEVCDRDSLQALPPRIFEIQIAHTAPAEAAVPAHLPEAAAKTFRAAEATFRNPDAAEVAAMAYRRSVEMALKDRRPDLAGDLRKRIDRLCEDGTIPVILRDWAHEVRLIGNDGAHELDGVSDNDLAAVRGFAEAFLRYFITLPTELELRRAATKKEDV